MNNYLRFFQYNSLYTSEKGLGLNHLSNTIAGLSKQ